MNSISTKDFVNDADYPTQFEGWICPHYKVWASMKNRVCKLYSDVGICKDWLVFSNFSKWMETQPWIGRQLDKDILGGDKKIYSPETCRFVPSWINTLVVRQDNRRGKYPIGVHHKPGYKRPFAAQVNDGLGGKLHLGYFNTPEEAHAEYLLGKAAVVKSAIERWKSSGLGNGDEDIIQALIKQYVEVEKYEQ